MDGGMTDLRTPQVWAAEYGIRIVRADGWYAGSPLGRQSYNKPIDRQEFVTRMNASTTSPQPKPSDD